MSFLSRTVFPKTADGELRKTSSSLSRGNSCHTSAMFLLERDIVDPRVTSKQPPSL
jgi:hypothetical protein